MGLVNRMALKIIIIILRSLLHLQQKKTSPKAIAKEKFKKNNWMQDNKYTLQ